MNFFVNFLFSLWFIKNNIQIPKWANFECKSLQKDIQDLLLMSPNTIKGYPTSLLKIEIYKVFDYKKN